MGKDTDSKLDTSGAVTIPSGPYAGDWTWDQVEAERGGFTQGYIEALFETRVEFGEQRWIAPLNETRAFQDLAPETLARIMEDCARFLTLAMLPPDVDADTGARFWDRRQYGMPGMLGYAFPPLTVTLNDAGQAVFQ